MNEYPVIESGYLTVSGKRYRYQISKMNVEFNFLPVCNHLDLWSESGVRIETVIFKGDEVSKVIERIIEFGKWK